MPADTPHYATRAEFENRSLSLRERFVWIALSLVVAAVAGIYVVQSFAAMPK